MTKGCQGVQEVSTCHSQAKLKQKGWEAGSKDCFRSFSCEFMFVWNHKTLDSGNRGKNSMLLWRAFWGSIIQSLFCAAVLYCICRGCFLLLLCAKLLQYKSFPSHFTFSPSFKKYYFSNKLKVTCWRSWRRLEGDFLCLFRYHFALNSFWFMVQKKKILTCWNIIFPVAVAPH